MQEFSCNKAGRFLVVFSFDAFWRGSRTGLFCFPSQPQDDVLVIVPAIVSVKVAEF